MCERDTDGRCGVAWGGRHGVDRGGRETRVGPGGQGVFVRGVMQRAVGINASGGHGGHWDVMEAW